MGPKRLSAAAFAVVLSSCTPPPAPGPVAAGPPPLHHAQIVRALTTPQRLALVAKLRERNGAHWQVNEAALATSTTVVDPFAGFLRRARSSALRPPAIAPVPEEAAAVAARAFVRKNADLLGLPQHVLLTLVEETRRVVPEDHAGGRAVWAVRFETTFRTKGYEAFAELENKVNLEVFVDDDGAPSMFANVSEIHPRLALDTKPTLGPDDDRLYAHLVGRRVFALDVDDTQVPLGQVQRTDTHRTQLVIYPSLGPMMAWITYRLAWGVGIAKRNGAFGQFFFFTWIVDADTGEVLADAVPPRLSP